MTSEGMPPEAKGQHQAVGNVLLCLGLVTLCFSVAGGIFALDLRYINMQSMAAFSGLMAVIGFWQRRQ
jgi:hypothetical protein